MKVALIHEKLLPHKQGGAERVLADLLTIWPEADMVTLVADRVYAKSLFPKTSIITSWLQHKPQAMRQLDLYRPLMPLAYESLDLREYDLIISNSHSFEKGVLTDPGQLHICYCLTPPRYLWHTERSLQRVPFPLLHRFAPPMGTYLRLWDRSAATRPDVMVGISHAVQDRIGKYYRRESQLIFPGVATAKYAPLRSHSATGGYYLLVARLEPHKEVELAISACNQSQVKLIIVGQGSAYRELKARSKSNIEFLGQVDEAQLVHLYQGAEAVLFPQEEDFGLVAVEAQAAGRPVIAYGQGGSLDTVIDGKTGVLFSEQTPEALNQAIGKSQSIHWNSKAIIKQAKQFDTSVFMAKWRALVAKSLSG